MIEGKIAQLARKGKAKIAMVPPALTRQKVIAPAMVDACAAAGIKPFYGPFGDITDLAACEQQFKNAFLMGCVGAWSLLDWLRDNLAPLVSGLPEALQSAEPTTSAITAAAAKGGPQGHMELAVLTLTLAVAVYRRIQLWRRGRL